MNFIFGASVGFIVTVFITAIINGVTDMRQVPYIGACYQHTKIPDVHAEVSKVEGKLVFYTYVQEDAAGGVEKYFFTNDRHIYDFKDRYKQTDCGVYKVMSYRILTEK